MLAEPQIPQNTGNVARTCAATGARLHLIHPMGFELSDKKMKRAGLDYWGQLNVCEYDGFDDFFTKTAGGEYRFFSTKAKLNYSFAKYSDNSYLVFGREDKGLPEELLWANFDGCVRIPMRGGLRSLNMSNSVAVGVYEVLRQWDFPDLT